MFRSQACFKKGGHMWRRMRLVLLWGKSRPGVVSCLWSAKAVSYEPNSVSIAFFTTTWGSSASRRYIPTPSEYVQHTKLILKIREILIYRFVPYRNCWYRQAVPRRRPLHKPKMAEKNASLPTPFDGAELHSWNITGDRRCRDFRSILLVVNCDHRQSPT